MGIKTKLPGLPALPSNTSYEVLQFLKAIKERVEIYGGHRGDKTGLDRVVQWRDLTDAGIARLAGTGVLTLGSGIMGAIDDAMGGGSPVVPLIPPTPTGFSGDGALQNIILEWDDPNYPNYAYTEVWRAEVNDLGQAVKIGSTPAFVYADPVGISSTTRYYWIRFVSTTGNVGPFNALGGYAAATAQIQTADLANLSVTTTKVVNDAITSEKVSPGNIADNAVLNSSFEDLAGADPTKAASWTYDYEDVGSAPTYSFGTGSDAYSGLQSLGISVPNTSAGASVACRSIPVAAGEIWFVSCWYKGALASADGFFFRVLFGTTENFSRASAASFVNVAADAAFTTAWQNSQGQVTVPAGAKYMRLAVYNYAPATATRLNFDDVTAVKAIISGVIVDAAIISAKIADLAVIEAKIANLAVGTAKIQDAAIVNAKIGNLAVDSAKIAALAVVTAKIADLNVTTAKIALANITQALIANAAIGNAQIQTAAIQTANIVDANITTLKVAGNAITIPVGAYTNTEDELGTLTESPELDGYFKIQTLTVPGSTGYPVFLNAYFLADEEDPPAGGREVFYAGVRIYRNGTMLVEMESGYVAGSHFYHQNSVTYVDSSPPSGSVVYDLYIQEQETIFTMIRSMFAMAIQR